MAAFPIYTGMFITGSPKAIGRRFRGIMKAELQNTARLWHKVFMPRHFRQGAEIKYRYQKRTANYQKRKRRKKGHNRPLTYTGDTRRMAALAPITSGTSKGAKARMNVPWYVRLIPTNPDRPSLGKEILATTEREAALLGEKQKQRVLRGMNRIRARERRAIR